MPEKKKHKTEIFSLTMDPDLRDKVQIEGIKEGHRSFSRYMGYLLLLVVEAYQANKGSSETLSAYLRRIIEQDAAQHPQPKEAVG